MSNAAKLKIYTLTVDDGETFNIAAHTAIEAISEYLKLQYQSFEELNTAWDIVGLPADQWEKHFVINNEFHEDDEDLNWKEMNFHEYMEKWVDNMPQVFCSTTWVNV